MAINTGRVLSRHGDWVVTTYGIENTVQYYPIKKGRVWEEYGGYGADSWIDHMRPKVWVNLEDFTAALRAAQARWPKKSNA